MTNHYLLQNTVCWLLTDRILRHVLASVLCRQGASESVVNLSIVNSKINMDKLPKSFFKEKPIEADFRARQETHI